MYQLITGRPRLIENEENSEGGKLMFLQPFGEICFDLLRFWSHLGRNSQIVADYDGMGWVCEKHLEDSNVATCCAVTISQTIFMFIQPVKATIIRNM